MEGETTFWLLSLPLEGRLSRGKDGIDQVVQVVKDKASDMATTHKVRLASSISTWAAQQRC